MSIVGTRPPLISETNLYEPHHKVTDNNFSSLVQQILHQALQHKTRPDCYNHKRSFHLEVHYYEYSHKNFYNPRVLLLNNFLYYLEQ